MIEKVISVCRLVMTHQSRYGGILVLPTTVISVHCLLHPEILKHTHSGVGARLVNQVVHLSGDGLAMQMEH